MKAAAKDLVDILEPSAAGTVAVALVPWSVGVRLDDETRARWHRDGWATYAERRRYRHPYFCRRGPACPPVPVIQDTPSDRRGVWHGCLEEARLIDEVDGVRDVADLPEMGDALALPSDLPFAEAYFPAYSGFSYQCLGPDIDVHVSTQYCWLGPTGLYQNLRPDPQRRCTENAPLIPLMTDGDAVKTAIDGLQGGGNGTYSALGVQWGRRLLAPEWREVWGDAVHPVDPAEPEHADVRKVLVLLTDGEDNACLTYRSSSELDPSCSTGAGTSRAAACEAAKDDGIEIFVIAAMEPSRVGRELGNGLRACATSSRHVYINNPDAQALRQAFRDIAIRLASVRRVS